MNNLENKRHTLAHLMAQAIIELYPSAVPTIGPAVENGWYYDFDFGETKITDTDLAQIETVMKKNLKNWTEWTKKDVLASEALTQFSDNVYKTELINEFSKEDKNLTFYTCGGFLDLCRGGHCEHPAKDISPDSFKIDKLAGAYWRGDAKNKQLTRVYGLAFDTKEELDKYIWQQEEAKKRDHRVLGKQQNIFMISELVGAGLPLLKPNGALIKRELENFLWDLHKDLGYERVWTPHLARTELYKISGHYEAYKENFQVKGKEEDFMMKPMNCPHHMQIFADNPVSYKDLPIRYFEPATVYRDEKSGQLSGLTRVRSITQDDGHLFCTPEQIKDEVTKICNVINTFYKTFNMTEYWVSLSVRGQDGEKDYLGSDEVWQMAEKSLEDAALANKLPYKRIEGEAAFYGPKLDFMFKDAIGREWQLATIQCDFNLPMRFKLEYTDNDGTKKQPVVIHRAISGSLERFMAIAIEHFAGAFPVWLSPVQVSIVPVKADLHNEFANKVYSALKEQGVRVELDDRNESLGKRIRAAKEMKTPYVIVIGDKERDSGNLTVETRSEKIEGISISDFVEKVVSEIKERTLN
jgi:threonyl-tRNA synthetase